MNVITSLLNRIGISEKDDHFNLFQNSLWKKKIPFRLHKGLTEIKPHSFLLYDNKIIALFFSSTSQDRSDPSTLFKKIWNLGGSPIVFIITDQYVDIYNGFSFNTKTYLFDKLKIGKVDVTIENINNTLSIWDIITGRSFEQLESRKTQVDEKLLENLENTKKILLRNGLEDTIAQSIIGRLLFSRYLLDRNVKINQKYFIDKKSFLKLIKNKELLYAYFQYLKETFNGDLFPVSKTEKSQVTSIHLDYLHELFSGSDIHDEGIQTSLFDVYDFNIIPVELISEVYERFIGKNVQKKDSAYYTPSFLVDYILEKTVKPFLDSHKSCKVFDPSCGSGIFLVESLRAIIERNLDKNGKIQKEQLKNILIENIFGIDSNPNALNLTVFSLCLTLLDYIEPKDITTFKLPNLLNTNLFIADCFDTNHTFNKAIKNIDFILGNPPWGSDKEKDNLHIRYFTSNSIPVSDKQIAQTYIARTKDFSASKTKCALVLPSKPILYNHNASDFRQYFLNNFELAEVLELSPVRSQIFSAAVAPTSVIFFRYSYNNNTEDNIVLHTSIKPNVFLKNLKLIVIEKNDIKQIKQSYFIKYDYLWKIMLYGNVLDFYLIKRLKEDFNTINQVIEKNKINFGQGFIRGNNGDYSPKLLLGKKYLDTKKKALSKFYINDQILENYRDTAKLYREGKYKGKIFIPPYVLLKKGFSKQDFSLVSAYTENEYVFTDSITAIRGQENDKSLLKNITGCLNSLLFSYHFLVQGSSAGVEREQGHNEEDRFTLPIAINIKISNHVDIIQNLYKQYHSELMHNPALEAEIQSQEQKLNEIIFDSFELSKVEKSLIDYAINVTIPQINNEAQPIAKITEDQLEQYAQIYINHFSSRWNGNPDFFAVDIYYNNYIVGMNFKVIRSKPKSPVQLYSNTNSDQLFNLIKLGEEKITDRFYKQRDIRGFNKSSFYIIKPNQYKNWHPAVAHGDMAEFIEAMLKADAKGK